MVVSIDIGTSYSTICIIDSNGNVRPVDVSTDLSLYGGKYSLPTAVFLEDNGELIVGQAAMNSRRKNPKNFRMEFKRELGSNIPIYLGSESFTPESLYTRIFLHLKECVEKISNESIEKAYITYPASYGKSKRDKIVFAAKSAGFFNIELLDEPTAAAMSFVSDGVLKSNQNLMVYDLGGGTFDVSLIHYDGKSSTLLSEPDGLEQCGGIDIDRMIFTDIMSKFDKEFLDQLKQNPLNYMKYECQLLEVAVKAKHHLSSAESFTEAIPIGLFDTIHYSLTRDKLNQMAAGLIGDTIQVCRNILENAEMEVKDLAAILMVGGTSRIPLVQDMVRQFAGNVTVLVAQDLELAVASGALEYYKTKVNPVVCGDWKKNVLAQSKDNETLSEEYVYGVALSRRDITEVTFTDSLKNMSRTAWDVSLKGDRSVMAWTVKQENDGYHLYIGGEGGVNGEQACANLFDGYLCLKRINFNGCFHTETTKSMEAMFRDCCLLCEIDAENLDTSNVENMAYMFYECVTFTKLNLSNFDTKNVKNMNSMFGRCGSLSELDISAFDTSSLEDMQYMFISCRSLKNIDADMFSDKVKGKDSAFLDTCADFKQKDGMSIQEKVQYFLDKNGLITEGYLNGEFDKNSYAKARMQLGIDEEQEIYLHHDDTIFKSGKNGYALTEKGIYVRKLWENPYYVRWETFINCPLEGGYVLDIGNGKKVEICYHFSSKVTTEVKDYMNTKFFVELQKFLLQ